jgi:hypothetical protein
MSDDLSEHRDEVWAKSGGICWYCGIRMSLNVRSPIYFTIDHFVPKARGGTDEMSNLVPACARCNFRKRHADVEAFRVTVARFWFETNPVKVRAQPRQTKSKERHRLVAADLVGLPKGKHHDGHGLYFVVKGCGPARSWVFRCKVDGRELYRGLGSYRTTSLEDARSRADQYRRLNAVDLNRMADA